MSVEPRPALVGQYRLLTDFESSAATVRVIALPPGIAVEPHVHQRSAQVYVALAGKVEVECDGVHRVIEPYASVAVPARSIHAARGLTADAVVMNISVPPLRSDDQVPWLDEPETPDLATPHDDADMED